ncbi:hypothetical protein [Mycobacterium avium]|uniref:hypothetical protein n=1 Tax=Mycobacterium avium TaxID=1764 RepID=UPI00111C64D4|nr:hypothetical protein [Mycobacterium avium]
MADEAPRVGTPEYEVLKYQRVAAGLNDAFGAEARVALVASFQGDGDTVDVCDVLQRAADYFKQHPELNVANAAWQTTVDRILGRKPRHLWRGEPIPYVAGRSPAVKEVGLGRRCIA